MIPNNEIWSSNSVCINNHSKRIFQYRSCVLGKISLKKYDYFQQPMIYQSPINVLRKTNRLDPRIDISCDVLS